ncbi:class I SAM-dependent methyltransferase, partial [Clostridium neonatale]|uniref:class I SAM-dependent methyltransferase n=1 Tax=Clostridium neonatale TaxID=137838 RepID=UPI003D332AAD
YKKAEKEAFYQYEKFIEPSIKKFSLLNNNSVVLDFACGKGRIAEVIRNKCRSLICCDISKEAIDSCKERFKKFENVKYIVGKENEIDFEDSSIDFIYSWDAMVHFSYKNIDRYLCEFFRIVKPGGYVFIHYSNLLNEDFITQKSELGFENIYCRSNIGKEDVEFLAIKHGFRVQCQDIIQWGEVKNLDCITILTKDWT